MEKTHYQKWLPITLMVLLLPLIFLLCLCFGSRFINPVQLIQSDLLNSIFSKPQSQIGWFIKLRTIRLFTGFFVGGGLAVSGVAYQAVLRNPLAEPFILGISGGASLGAAIAFATGIAAYSFYTIPLFSFFGAIVVMILVLMMARGAGMAYTNNVMLSGIIVGTVCSSMLMFIISVLGFETLRSITWWMLSSLQPANNHLLILVGTIVTIGTFIFFLFGRDANAISLGEEMAYYLGLSPRKLIFFFLGLSSFLTASAVALSGIIGFVGLIIPHILRRLFGADHRQLFPMALIGGGMFLMICDTVARTVLNAQEIPVGVVTALIGGPFFLWLLNKKT